MEHPSSEDKSSSDWEERSSDEEEHLGDDEQRSSHVKRSSDEERPSDQEEDPNHDDENSSSYDESKGGNGSSSSSRENNLQWNRQSREYFERFSTSGHLSEAMHREEQMTDFSDEAAAVIDNMDPSVLEELSKGRARDENSETPIPCVYGWPWEYDNSVVIPLTFGYGVKWAVQLPTIGEINILDRIYALECLRNKLGSVVPRLIKWSSGSDEKSMEPFGISFVLMERARRQLLSNVLNSYLGFVQIPNGLGGAFFGRADKERDRLIQCFDDLAYLTLKLGKTVDDKCVFFCKDQRSALRLHHTFRQEFYTTPRSDISEKLKATSLARSSLRDANRPNPRELEIFLRLMRKAESTCAQKKFPLHISYDDILMDEETGHVTSIIVPGLVIHAHALCSIYAYPRTFGDSLGSVAALFHGIRTLVAIKTHQRKTMTTTITVRQWISFAAFGGFAFPTIPALIDVSLCRTLTEQCDWAPAETQAHLVDGISTHFFGSSTAGQ